jgi:DNA-binding NarL/FixJ family response regulator
MPDAGLRLQKLSMTARILLADDHPIMCAGLALTVEREPGLKVVGQAHDDQETLTQFRELAPDLVIMDVHLGGSDGIRIAEQILAASAQTRIITLFDQLVPGTIDRAILAGVHGCLLKTNAPEELLRAIRTVLAGHSHLCPQITDVVLANYQKLLSVPAIPDKPLLTDRELEVLKLTAEGLRVKEIAERLNIGVKTVDTYRSSLFTKIECSSVAELTRYAVREGLVRP